MAIRVYRCYDCKKSYTEYKIKDGVGCGCGSRKLTPTYPRWYEIPFLIMEVLCHKIKK